MNNVIKHRISYSTEFKRFFTQVLRQRVYLLKAGKSKRNTAQMQSVIDRLMPYRSYTFTDRGAATFLLKKHDDILRLIPAPARATLQQLDKLAAEARYLLKYNSRIPW